MHFEQAGEAEKAIDYYVVGRPTMGSTRNAIREAYAAAGAALRLMGTAARR